MDRIVFERITDMQEEIRNDEEYRRLLQEHEILNERFLEQLKTMNHEQIDAVMDYCGWLIEMHWKMLEYSVNWGG